MAVSSPILDAAGCFVLTCTVTCDAAGTECPVFYHPISKKWLDGDSACPCKCMSVCVDMHVGTVVLMRLLHTFDRLTHSVSACRFSISQPINTIAHTACPSTAQHSTLLTHHSSPHTTQLCAHHTCSTQRPSRPKTRAGAHVLFVVGRSPKL
jgi:hypothetical protein